MESIADCLRKKGFTHIKVDNPGSIQVCANHPSGGAIWFYSKHNVAFLSIYDSPWAWAEEDAIDIHQKWKFMPGEEVGYIERPIENDMGGLLEDREVLQLIEAMWNQYTTQAKGA